MRFDSVQDYSILFFSSLTTTAVTGPLRRATIFRHPGPLRSAVLVPVFTATYTLRRFWTMTAHYHGQIWNAAELARSMDVSPNTVRHYMDILSGAYVLRVLAPWYENLKKRQVKSPKVYVRDSGLLHFLLGIASMSSLRSNPRYGASWEGFAIEQTLAIFGERDAFFWGTQRGAELDLVAPTARSSIWF